MAKPTKKPRSTLAELTPRSIAVNIDGQEIRVATTKEENRIANMIVASQMRCILQDSIKRYREMDTHMTPKELRDLAESAAAIARFSGEVYESAEQVISHEGPMKVDQDDDITDIDFETLKPNGDKNVQPDQPTPDAGKVG